MSRNAHRMAALAAMCLVLGAVVTALGASGSEAVVSPPNIVIVLVDDLGWTDLGCYGSTFYETPAIDRLAASGMRFTQGYAACTVCSPTRAALLTGRYPARLHITDWITGHQRPFAKLLPPDWTQHLPHDETTIAEIFAAHGYATCHVGKWHLGGEEFAPTTQGFAQNIGGNHRGQPPSYFFPYERNDIRLPGLSEGTSGEYLTDRLTDEAIRFIEANCEKPFLLYLPHYTVHTPLQAKEDLIAKYRGKARPDRPQHNATYAAMIASLDKSVGRLLKTLDDLKLRKRTIVVFTSDNGGLELNEVTANDPLREGKGSAYEGGVRVPLIVSYPGQIATGTTSDTPAMTIDLLPTLFELSGRPVEETLPTLDGVSLVPALLQQGTVERDALYWHYPHYHPGGATPYGAVRAGDWRLVEFYEDGKTELYNLRQDIGEAHDLAAEQTIKRDELLAKLRSWRESVGAQMPVPNPNYDPERAAQPRNANPPKGKRKAAK